LSRSSIFNFSHVFDGVIWNTLSTPENDVILLEIRNSEKKNVAFSALDFQTQKFLWKGKQLEEPWWISLSAASANVILFTIFTDTANPDKKGIIAYDLFSFELLWWNNDFSLVSVSNSNVIGISNKFGNRQLSLELRTGKEIKVIEPEEKIKDKVLRPSQYQMDHRYFDTVKTFLGQRFNLLPITALEYLEYQSLIFISCYLQEDALTNYLFIISEDGNLLLKEKLDEHVKGIGLDTFFILSGCVFFVKNKVELVSYKIL
jgi:hypothetical protein